MKKILALLIGAVLVMAMLAGCGGSSAPAAEEAPAAAPAEAAPAADPAAPADVTWDDYIDWLASTIGANSPDPDDFRAMLAQAKSWDEIDVTSPPWDKMFDENAFDASTWDEFVAAGGVGTYNADYQDSALTGSGEPTGEASGEPTAEPAA